MTFPRTRVSDSLSRWLTGLQGAYFAVLGIWPIVDMRSFQAVTGPKTDHIKTGDENDHWLVITVGSLIAVIGISLLIACWRKSRSYELAALGLLSALSLMAVDLVYAWRKVIGPIYLADAAVELMFAASWVCVLFIAVRRNDLPA